MGGDVRSTKEHKTGAIVWFITKPGSTPAGTNELSVQKGQHKASARGGTLDGGDLTRGCVSTWDGHSAGQLKPVGAVKKSGLIRIAVFGKKSGRNPAKIRARRPQSWYMYVHAACACASL